MHIGIYGTGQLARMMAEAGQSLGITFSFVKTPGDDSESIKGLGNVVTYSGHESAKAIFDALGSPQIVTVEKEDVDLRLLSNLKNYCRVAPDPQAVSITQNRLEEKTFINNQGIPTVPFAEASSPDDVLASIKNLGLPVVIKSLEQGYDGKNQWTIKTEEDIDKFVCQFPSQPLIVEKWVAFEAEVSMIAARSLNGHVAFYPLTENKHQNGILLTSKVPTLQFEKAFEEKAKSYLDKLLTELNYVGVLAMECFIVDGELLVNELAPRVHNSGHWTQAGTSCSQFENHLRAIMGIVLGDTELKTSTAMLNLLGKQVAERDIKLPNAQLHWYDKACKPARKVGHINIQHSEYSELERNLNDLEKQIYQ
ncbi:5-(carboxyamino)imidazole ribonucleotide synthase [Pleionea sediminis]|uniref:5-(carboxyamino)imidazole ribonucleotide synthase n=1 Tax=Pleionea sediminis TaxID=2569479 RepID=UPI00118630C5|nr:5-(carboxyamino)imidazole ribonucleotide synthase [Pleionea sediminis]